MPTKITITYKLNYNGSAIILDKIFLIFSSQYYSITLNV